MAHAFVQSSVRTLVTAVDSTTVVINGVSTSNDLVLSTSVFNSSAGDTITVTGGGTWAQAVTRLGTDTGYEIYIHYLAAPTGGNTTITIDPVGTSADVAGVVAEFSGMGALDVAVSNAGTGLAPLVVSGALAESDELLVAIAGTEGPPITYLPDGTYTQLAESETDPGYNAQYKIVATSASDQADWVIGASIPWIAALASFRGAGGGPDLNVGHIGEPVIGGSTF